LSATSSATATQDTTQKSATSGALGAPTEAVTLGRLAGPMRSPEISQPFVLTFLAVTTPYWATIAVPRPVTVAPEPAANVGWPAPSHMKSTSAPMANDAVALDGRVTVIAAALDRVTNWFSSAGSGA
jgi:hypothetical protein